MKYLLKCFAIFTLALNVGGVPSINTEGVHGNHPGRVCMDTLDAELCDVYCQKINKVGECVDGKCVCAGPTNNGLLYVATADDLRYHFFPVSSDFVQFRVRAPKDAHIILSSEPKHAEPNVEVFIGGWENKLSVIRKNGTRPEKAQADTPDILSGTEYRGFWVRWDGGIISAGREGQAVPFVSWEDPQPFPIGFVGFCTGWGAYGSWKMQGPFEMDSPDTESCDGYCREFDRFGEIIEEKCECIGSNKTIKGTLYLATDNDLQYHYFPVSSSLVKFKVRASIGAHIALMSGPQISEHRVEVIIGGWNNTESAIKKYNVYMDKVDTPDILNGNEYRGFWIKWDGGVIMVGREGQTVPFLSWKGPNQFPIGLVGFRTELKASGFWKIQGVHHK